MLTTEMQQDTHSGPVTLNPRWLRIPAAVKYSGLSRSRLYELLSEKKIRSICLKSHKGAERGVRLLLSITKKEKVNLTRGRSGVLAATNASSSRSQGTTVIRTSKSTERPPPGGGIEVQSSFESIS